MPKSKAKKSKKQAGGAFFKPFKAPDQGLVNFKKPMPNSGPAERKRPTVQPVITGEGFMDALADVLLDPKKSKAAGDFAKQAFGHSHQRGGSVFGLFGSPLDEVRDRLSAEMRKKAIAAVRQRGGAGSAGWDAPPPSGPAPVDAPVGVGAPDYYNAPNSPPPLLPPAGAAPPAYQAPDPYANGGVDMKYFYDVPKPSEVPFIDPGEPSKKGKKLGGIVSAFLRGIGARSLAEKAAQSGWGAQQQTGGAVTGAVPGMTTC